MDKWSFLAAYWKLASIPEREGDSIPLEDIIEISGLSVKRADEVVAVLMNEGVVETSFVEGVWIDQVNVGKIQLSDASCQNFG